MIQKDRTVQSSQLTCVRAKSSMNDSVANLCILASAMEVMNANFDRNVHAFQCVKPQAVVLDWEDEELPGEVHEGIDLIMSVSVRSHNPFHFPLDSAFSLGLKYVMFQYHLHLLFTHHFYTLDTDTPAW